MARVKNIRLNMKWNRHTRKLLRLQRKGWRIVQERHWGDWFSYTLTK